MSMSELALRTKILAGLAEVARDGVLGESGLGELESYAQAECHVVGGVLYAVLESDRSVNVSVVLVENGVTASLPVDNDDDNADDVEDAEYDIEDSVDNDRG